MGSVSYRKQYADQGYVILRGFLPDTLVGGMIQVIDDLVDGLALSRLKLGAIRESHENEPMDMRFRSIFSHDADTAPIQFSEELHAPAFWDLITNTDLLSFAEEVLGPEIRLAPGYFARPKAFPNHRFQSLWHQDPAYLLLGNQGHPREAFDRIRIMNVWTPLVPVNKENGCMQFLPGTHRNGMANHCAVAPFDYLEIEQDVLMPALESIEPIDIVLDPGDVVLFDTLLFHQGQDNLSGRVRWSLDFRFQDARQPTLIDLQGHLLRSKENPDKVVSSRSEWCRLSAA